MLSNCTNSYVKNKKIIKSPDDLQKFVNVYCDKNKSTNKVIKVCGNGWSKDLNISENKAENLFNEIEKFAGYGFNKSHAAAYAKIAYQTAF